MHKPAIKLEADFAAVEKSKLGVKLFIVYTLVYLGFVIIGLVNPELLSLHVLGEQNLATIYGYGLIVMAILMGFIYNALCNKLEDKMNENKEKSI